MDTNIAQKIARAFVHGLAFAKGMSTLAQDAKAKMEEGDKWITIGAEPGDDGKKHGGRHVLISGTGEVKAGLSKSAQGKTLGQVFGKGGEFSSEGGKSKGETARKAGERASTKRAEAEKARKDATRESSVSREVPKSFDLSAKEIKDLTDKLRDYTDDRTGSYEFGRKLQDMANLSAEIDKMDKRYLSSMGQHNLEAARHHLGLAAKAARAVDNYQWRGAISSLRTEITRRLNTANKLYQDTIRGQVQGLENANTPETKKAESAPETHTYSAKELDSMKQKQEGRIKAKKQNAELNRKFKEGVESGNIRFPRNEFRERAKAYTEQANQVINDDLKPSVDKLGSAIRKNTDNARMPQSTLDDLNDIHNLAKQIGPMASKLNKYNEKYAAEHDDPSNYVISNYGAATKGTAETVASLARRAAAMSNQLTAPDDERDYSEGRAKQEIRDILTEMRGLHGDLLKKTRHAATAFNTSKPSNSESDRVDAMYAQKGSKPKQRIIN